MKLFREKTEVQNEPDTLSAHREQMLLPLSAVGAVSFFPFFIYDFYCGNYLLGIAVFALTLLFFVNGYAIYRRRKIPIPFEILLIPASISITLSIINQGVFGTYWSYPLLLFFYFVLSRRTANLCGISLLVVVTIIVLLYIGPAVTIRYAISLGLLMVLTNIIIGTLDDLHHQLIDQSIKDPLTGAFNRRYMESRLGDAIAQKQRKATPASVLLFDIDFFKQINDRAGHAAGDVVLKDLVQLILKQTRRANKLFRIGGEEFLLFLPETGEEDAAKAAEHLRELIANSLLTDEISITVSIGVSELKEGETLDEWIKCADEALYRAKEGGRNRIEKRQPGQAAEKTLSETKTIK